MIEKLRSLLRSNPHWVHFQELNQEGWRNAYVRHQIQQRILSTAPVQTPSESEIEVHVLSWRKDYINMIWALKSFYMFEPPRFALNIHDGGLYNDNKKVISEHFPNAKIICPNTANNEVEKFLNQKKLKRCVSYRQKNIATKKVFDFFILSPDKRIVSFDSDVLFFKKPMELYEVQADSKRNFYNKDCQYGYSLAISDLQKEFGISIKTHINSGIFTCEKNLFDYEQVEKWLDNKELFDNNWVTEQTLHALMASTKTVDYLPETYEVNTKKSDLSKLCCKHYPGYFRTLLYQEGMKHLIDTGFLEFYS